MRIRELTKEAEEHANNIVQSNDNDYAWGFLRDQKFAELVEAAARADEREECAKLVEEIEAQCVADDVDDPPLQHVVAAIRARGTT